MHDTESSINAIKIRDSTFLESIANPYIRNRQPQSNLQRFPTNYWSTQINTQIRHLQSTHPSYYSWRKSLHFIRSKLINTKAFLK